MPFGSMFKHRTTTRDKHSSNTAYSNFLVSQSFFEEKRIGDLDRTVTGTVIQAA
jgi:hypothetical protein